DVLSAIVNQPPIAPHALNPAVPLELDRIITKALEKHPALRYQTASDLRADLLRLKRDLDRASSVHTESPIRQWVRSSRWLRTAAVVGTSAVVGSGWLAIASVRARSSSSSSSSSSGSAASPEILRGTVPGADVELRPEIKRPE